MNLQEFDIYELTKTFESSSEAIEYTLELAASGHLSSITVNNDDDNYTVTKIPYIN